MEREGSALCKDLNMAKQFYFRCREVDPSGLHAPVTIALAALAGHVFARHGLVAKSDSSGAVLCIASMF